MNYMNFIAAFITALVAGAINNAIGQNSLETTILFWILVIFYEIKEMEDKKE